jgi:hypothetical protein
MKLLKQLFCEHGWEPQGWDSVACRKCGKVTSNPALNHCLSGSRDAYYSTTIAEAEAGAVKPAPCD